MCFQANAQNWSLTGNSIASGDYIGNSGNSQPFIFKMNATEIMRIHTDGKIGIGVVGALGGILHINGLGSSTSTSVKLQGSIYSSITIFEQRI